MKCKQHPEVAKKKYCYDCKFRPMNETALHSWFDDSATRCCKVLKETHKDTPARHEVNTVRARPKVDNKKNNCPYFQQRRWWE